MTFLQYGFILKIIERYTIVQKKFQVLLKINAVRNRSCSSHPIYWAEQKLVKLARLFSTCSC